MTVAMFDHFTSVREGRHGASAYVFNLLETIGSRKQEWAGIMEKKESEEEEEEEEDKDKDKDDEKKTKICFHAPLTRIVVTATFEQ